MLTQVKAENLRDVRSFALLGGAFAVNGPWLVVDGLEPCGVHEADIIVARYEDRDGACAAFRGRTREIDLVLGPPRPVEPVLQPGDHAAGVQRIREAIAAGDVYQVNLTLRALLPPMHGDELLSTLCRRGTPAFPAWVRLPDGSEFVSASPELFFNTVHGDIGVQPMKGTAPLDQRAAFETSAKDIAELAMITDLLRNDLASTCKPGSVEVARERGIEELPYALQATSTVRGDLLPGTTIPDLLRALHPGGSITGAPKPAAMRMIRELERSPRGFYCGTLVHRAGPYLTASLLIRTAERMLGGWVYGVGGGIVWDSDAEAEWREVQVKLGALR